MVSTVVGFDGQEVKGYLVDDIFIKKCHLKYFIGSDELSGINKVGKYRGSSIDIEGFTYKEIISIIKVSNYIDTLNKLRLNGLVLNKLIFVQCKLDDIDKNGLSEFWRYVSIFAMNSMVYYAWVDTESNRVVAYMLSQDNIFKSDRLHISMLEVIDKDKGWGTDIVKTMQKYGVSLTGISVVKARSFWHKVGAKFISGDCFEIY